MLALVLGLTHNNSHTRLVFQKVFMQASLLQYTHLVHLNAEEICLKRKIKVWPLLEEVEAVLLLGFFFSLQLITSSPLLYFNLQVSISYLSWNDIFLVESILKQDKLKKKKKREKERALPLCT